ncbi:MAG: N-acetylmuramoyl-L-alanine amidase [Chloroflexota bacterium]
MRWAAVIPMVLAFALLAPAPALAAPPSYYPPLDWIPAARSNYDVGRTAAIRVIVIHETDGSYISAANWFMNPRSRVSAHYLVRAWGGGITQFVAESDTAYHARNANPYTIGIETEYNPRQAIWHTDAQYRSAALLACAIARRYGIPTDRAHIVGHRELPGADHADPGPTWNWSYYMSLVNACSWQRVQPVARAALRTVANHGYVPTPGLEFDNVSDEVALLQWDLVYLGFMDADEVAGGGSRFGPLTEVAVKAFQEAKGVETTGSYGEQTAAALVESILADPAGVPAKDLNSGDESDDVGVLQTALQELGYMDMVTGYYGDITTDAMTTFQHDNGVYATGTYGPITRMALASRVRAAIAREEVQDEVVSEAVTFVGMVMFEMLVP